MISWRGAAIFIATQLAVLLLLPPSPFQYPAAPANVFVYGVIACAVLLAWGDWT